MAKIKTNDEVIVIAGKDKGRRGKVVKVISESGKVVVAGLNMAKKHVRPNPQRNIQGGIVEQEAAIDISNIAIYNPTSNKADRVGYKIQDDGKKVRIFKSNGEQVGA
jgi:large subunit ribosomal protein L24